VHQVSLKITVDEAIVKIERGKCAFLVQALNQMLISRIRAFANLDLIRGRVEGLAIPRLRRKRLFPL
jgi:hypothetical protein